jgi:hypothetical protein
MVFCNICNKEYKRKSHLKSKKHLELYNKNIISFKEINENLNEYNLVKICINYVKETIVIQYERIKDKLNEVETYENEIFSLEFIKKYEDELDFDNIVENLEKYKINKLEFIKEFNENLDSEYLLNILENLKGLNNKEKNILIEIIKNSDFYNYNEKPDNIFELIPENEFYNNLKKNIKNDYDLFKLLEFIGYGYEEKDNLLLMKIIEDNKDIIEWKYTDNYDSVFNKIIYIFKNDYHFMEKYNKYIPWDDEDIYSELIFYTGGSWDIEELPYFIYNLGEYINFNKLKEISGYWDIDNYGFDDYELSIIKKYL